MSKTRPTTSRRATYAQMKRTLYNLLFDLSVLAGDEVGATGSTWQEVAAQAAHSADVLSRQLSAASKGNHESFIAFPSHEDAMEYVTEENGGTKDREAI